MPFYKYGKDIKYSIEDLFSIDDKLIENFSCGNTEIDKVLKDESSMEYTVKVVVDTERNCLIGFIAYQASGIRLHYKNTYITKSALQVNYFAIDTQYQHLPYDELDNEDKYNFSDEIFCQFLKLFREISDKYLYFEYIILYSVPNARNFYLRNCFEDFNIYMNPDNYRYLDGCMPMFATV